MSTEFVTSSITDLYNTLTLDQWIEVLWREHKINELYLNARNLEQWRLAYGKLTPGPCDPDLSRRPIRANRDPINR